MRKIKYSATPYKKYTQLLGVCLLLVLISGCDRPPDTLKHSAAIPFSITWQPELPRAEQPIVFSLTLPAELIPELSEVRGVSMYMGRIPLQWQQVAPGYWQATLVVGACSEPTMHWQLTVPLRTAASEPSAAPLEPLRVSFYTVTN
jgi:hypothetical protein